MSDQIDDKMLSDWRINYGLDTRTPAEAMRWWHDNMDGKAPAGAVAALGLCIDELDRLRADAERYRWLRGGKEIPAHSVRWARWEVRQWCGGYWYTMFAEQMDAAIDAARGKE